MVKKSDPAPVVPTKPARGPTPKARAAEAAALSNRELKLLRNRYPFAAKVTQEQWIEMMRRHFFRQSGEIVFPEMDAVEAVARSILLRRNQFEQNVIDEAEWILKLTSHVPFLQRHPQLRTLRQRIFED